MIFALTTNAIIEFICIYYVFLHVFIEISVFIGNYYGLYFSLSGSYLFKLYFYCIYWKCTCLFLFICIYNFYCFFYIYWVGSNFLLFNTCTIKFIEGKFYFEGRACYIGKIMPTCIE